MKCQRGERTVRATGSGEWGCTEQAARQRAHRTTAPRPACHPEGGPLTEAVRQRAYRTTASRLTCHPEGGPPAGRLRDLDRTGPEQRSDRLGLPLRVIA